MNARIWTALLPLGLVLADSASAQIDLERARRNYLEVVSGRKQPLQLSPIEQEEVIALARALKDEEKREPETRARCLERNGSKNPSQLEQAILDLKCSQRR